MNVVSKRYAKALLDALSPEKAEAGLSQLRQLSDMLAREPDMRKLLEQPAFPPDRRESFLGSIADALDLEAPVRKLFSMLVDRRRIAILNEIVEACQAQLDERTGTLRVKVTSAGPLGEAEKSEITERLGRSTGKRVVMEVDHDASIIGGLVVRVGSTVMDASLRQQLASFQRRLLAD